MQQKIHKKDLALIYGCYESRRFDVGRIVHSDKKHLLMNFKIKLSLPFAIVKMKGCRSVRLDLIKHGETGAKLEVQKRSKIVKTKNQAFAKTPYSIF